ncbi:MAG TPA: hypothetical protein ENI77_11125 [Nitrospirae bacterium]|nr:hypothetical protein [Nitrospirota bacterium]
MENEENFEKEKFSIRECANCHKLVSLLLPVDAIDCIYCGAKLENVRLLARKKIETTATITNGVVTRATTVDISTGGMRIQYHGSQIPTNAKVIVDADELSIHRPATAVWSSGAGADIAQSGLEYTERRAGRR